VKAIYILPLFLLLGQSFLFSQAIDSPKKKRREKKEASIFTGDGTEALTQKAILPFLEQTTISP